MGLDMYLYAEKYVSGYDHNPDPEFKNVTSIITIPPSEGSKHALVKLCVAYWRKANAIHGWFVENVQGGEDECKPHHVNRAQLEELRELAAEALDALEKGDKRVAADKLTPTDGFYFGSTTVDEGYAYDLKITVEQLDRVLSAADEHVDFIYRSSW